MNSILRVLRMAGDSENRYWTVAFLAGVDLVCLFEAGDSFREHQWRAGVIWLLIATLYSLIGYHWPRIKQRFPLGKGERNKRKVGISAAAMSEHLAFERQFLLQRLATEEKESVRSSDWQQLAAKFESSPKQLRATWNRYEKPAMEKWDIGGWTEADKCRALCRLAGAMLTRSRRVRHELPEEILESDDPMDRWLNFLKKLRGFDDYRSGVESLDDGSNSLVSVGVINSVTERSVAACIECAAKEM